MSQHIVMSYSAITGTAAGLGRSAAGQSLIADRPDGIAGGQGLGFNGAELLALALGGCFCNDLRYVAHEQGVALGKIAVDVTVELEGDPLITTAATMAVRCETLDGSDPNAVIEQAKKGCMVSNSLQRGVAVEIRGAA